MRNLKSGLCIALLALPLSAVAHGEDVLIPIFVVAISLIILVVVIAFIKETIVSKVILFSVYITVLLLSAYFLMNGSYGDYLSNEIAINVQLVAYPVLADIVVYFAMKALRK